MTGIPSRKVARFAVTIIAVPLVLWAFLSTLVKGIGRTFADALTEVRIEAEELRRTWRDGFKPDGGRYDDWN